MFSCISDDVDWSGEGSLNDSSQGSGQSAARGLQTKCTRLSRLLEETEIQRCRDRRQYERDLAAARREYDAQISILVAQQSADSDKTAAALRNRLAVAESEVVYWRCKFQRQGGESLGAADQPLPGALPAARSLLHLLQTSAPADGRSPAWAAHTEGAHTEEAQGREGGEESALYALAAQKEATDVLRLQHQKLCHKLQERVAAATAEAAELAAEVDRLNGLLGQANDDASQLRLELKDVQQRLGSVVSSRVAVEEKVKSVLAENYDLQKRLDASAVGCNATPAIVRTCSNDSHDSAEARYHSILSSHRLSSENGESLCIGRAGLGRSEHGVGGCGGAGSMLPALHSPSAPAPKRKERRNPRASQH